MRKLLLSLTLIFGALALAGCAEGDYEEYEYDGDERIEIDMDDERDDWYDDDDDEEYDD